MGQLTRYHAAFVILLCCLPLLVGCATTRSEAPTGVIASQSSGTPTGKQATEGAGDPRLERILTVHAIPGKGGMDAEGLLQSLSEMVFGGQFLISPDFQGKFLGTIESRPLREVLDAICRETHCTWEVTGSGALKVTSSGGFR